DVLLPQNNVLFLKEIIINNYSPYVLIAVLISLVLFIRYYKEYSIYEKIISLWTIISFVLLVFIIPKYEGSYLIPFNVLLAVSLYISFSKTKISNVLILCLIIIVTTKFPLSIYQYSIRPIANYENAAKYISNNYQSLKNDSFNVIQVSDPGIQTPVGNEYRFFLRKYGLDSLPETNYKDASSLVIISEIGELDISKIDNWEMNEFGEKHYDLQKNKYRNVDIYVLKKSPVLN
ncbi:MAG: hypothetical protein C0412_14525, partial [Flavobacterium sp.]|nr:hypothetical protein [Flavobacterium sp.]